ncbi:MAG: FtsX-like permease family protein, partial [Atopostipes suicloacalis]|nr:FtsX-like permease family protein [Atopostipes suicloacalis]
RTEIDDGWEDLEEGKEELRSERENAQNEINKNEQELQEGRSELEKNKKELQEEKKNLENKRDKLQKNEKELNNGISKIEKALPEVQNGLKEINNNLPELKSGIEKVNKKQEELKNKRNDIQKALDLPEVNHEEINTQIKQIEKQIKNLQKQDPVPEEQIKELQMQKAELEEALKIPEVDHQKLEKQLAEVENGLNELENQKEELNGQLQKLENKKQELKQQENDLNQQLAELKKQKEQLTQGKDEINSGLNQIKNGLEEIKEKEREIQKGFDELAEAKNTLAEEMANAQEELDNSEAELKEAEEEYQENLALFEAEKEDALEEIQESEADLEKAEEDLDKLAAPDYQSFDRTDNSGYSEYKDNADRLSVIAKVFPVFFFLIAIFISFTTMTRMVDEEREYIGIMKAMGYKNRHILIKFIVYASIATVIGSILGLAIGYSLFPTLIFYAYESMYNFPELYLQQYNSYTIIALIFAFVSTVGASLLAVRYSLRSNAARLLQPKPPKKGSRIWLEKIPFIWNKLSFNFKITFRNVFRYKSRMLMTILGIAGSTGLILTGFGISDSIGGILDIQYGEINQFQAYVAINPSASSTEIQDYHNESQNMEAIENEIFVLQKNVQAKEEEMSTQDITFFVPENPENLDDFVQLTSKKSGNTVDSMDDSGVYITDKIAQLLDLDIGDNFEVLNADDEQWKAEVAGVVENYVGHFAYMTPNYYEEVTGEKFDQPDVQLIKYDNDEVDTDQLGSQLIEEEAVAGIQYVDDIYDSFAKSLESLDLITQILIISAAALAFIVLYNLTNINVSERRRELSTIKVLGSYDYEVTSYIYRENIILTLLGISVGLGFGKILTNFIMETMEIDMLVFGRNIYLPSYFYASMLT